MRRLLTLLLAAMAFVACTQNEVEELSVNREALPETLIVGFEGSDTRIELNEVLKTVWTEGDEVSVFYRSYENMRWAFQGETGDRSGELKRVSGEVGAQTMDNSIIVYPYSDSYAIDADTHAVTASLPAVQSYKEGSYGAEGNIMVAESKFTQFTLKSVVGWLRVELTGEGEVVESIKVRGNNGEQVAGLCYINAADASIALAESEVDESLVATEVVLNCGEGVELGAEATEFYIALLPQTFDKGLTVEVDYANAEPQTLVYENNVTIRRNHISPINIETSEEAEVPTNQLWYTATAKVEPYNASAFNVTIASNEWNEVTGEGVITFDGELTTIGVQAFMYCYSLTSVTIPDSVTMIGFGAFYNCTSLTSVTIPDSVTTIGEVAFASCSSLAEFKGKFAADGGRCLIIDGVLNAFALGCGVTEYTIPDSVTTIGRGAFENCDSLTSVTIPDSVTTIGEYAFSDCSSLTSVTISDSITTIGEAAFASCSSLTSVIIPDSVTTIGYAAFHNCTSLTSVTIPDSVTTIGDYAFNHCESLTSVTIGDSVTTIGYAAFAYCYDLTSVTIPDSVTTIGYAAFVSCSSLAEFKGKFAADGGRCLIKDNTLIAYAEASGNTYTIPDSVTTIGNYAFYDCDSLTSVTIPDSVTTIGNEAFYQCFSLTSVTIPDNVTTIGNSAFLGCSSLTSVYCKATTPPTLGGYVFKYWDESAQEYLNIGCPIYVPAESFNYYPIAEGWDDVADHLVAYDYENNTEVEVAISYITLSYVDRVVCESGAYQYSPRILGEWGKDVTVVRYTVVEGFVDNVDEYITTDPEQGFDVNGNTDGYIIPELASGRYTMIAISYTGEPDNLQRGSVASVQFMIQANDGDEVALDLSLYVGSVADLTGNPNDEINKPSSDIMGIYIATPEAKYIAEGYIDFYVKGHDGEELTPEQIDGYLAGKRFEIIQRGWIDSIIEVSGITGADSICVMLKVTTIFGTNHYYHIDYDVPVIECALATETYTISDNGYAMSVTISPYLSLDDCRVNILFYDATGNFYSYSAICSVDSERGEIVGNIKYIGVFFDWYGETQEKALYAFSRDSQGSEVVNAPIRFSFDADGYLTSINTYFEAYAEQYDGSLIGTYPDTIEEVLYITPNAVITRASSASKASYSARTSTPLKVELFGKM